MGRHVRPLAWGLTAALAGTMAANFFYLTMQFYYFFGFVALALALPSCSRARADVKVLVLTTSYPRDDGRSCGALRRRRRRGGARSAGSRSRSSRRRRSGTSGSRTGTASSGTCAAAVARAARAGLPLATSAARRAGRDVRSRARALARGRGGGGDAAEAVRRAGVGHGRRARAARRRGSPGWILRRARARRRRVRRSSPGEARALGARDVRVVPSGVDVPEAVGRAGRAAARALRRPPVAGEGHPASSSRPPSGLPLVVVGDGPLARRPESVGVRRRRRARRVLRARRRRLRAVTARGLRRGRARGDGVRAAGRGDAPSAASSTPSTTA